LTHPVKKPRILKKAIYCSILWLLAPIGILTTAIIRHQPTYQSRTILEWFDGMQMDPKSPNLMALREIGKPAVLLLREDLTSGHIDYRIKAAWALGQLGPPALEAAPSLIQALNDDSPIVKYYAVLSLAALHISTDVLISGLMSKLDENTLGVANSAANLLNQIERERNRDNIPFVADEFEYDMVFLRSSVYYVRVMGLERLIKIKHKDERVMAEFYSLTNDANLSVREMALSYANHPGIMERIYQNPSTYGPRE